VQALFVRLEVEAARAVQELARAEELTAKAIASTDEGHIVRTAYFAHVIDEIYEALENILEDIGREVDFYLPRGDDWHRKLLSQMAAPIPGGRDAVLSRELA
jgi:hypothetical protein